MLQNFNLSQRKRISVIKNWLGREGQQLIATLTQEEQEACNNEKGLFKTLNKKLKPQYNETIKSFNSTNWSGGLMTAWKNAWVD